MLYESCTRETYGGRATMYHIHKEYELHVHVPFEQRFTLVFSLIPNHDE